MNHRTNKKNWLLWSVFAAAVFIPLLSLIGSRSDPSRIATAVIGTVVSVGLLTLIVVLIGRLFATPAPLPQDQALMAKPANPVVARTLATLIGLCLIVGSYCATHSLGLTPEDGKFIYNNAANILGISALALILILRAVQSDIYWIPKSKKLRLDEWQTKRRHEVIETSYKISVWIVLLNAFWLSSNKANLPRLVNDMTNFSVTPGAYYWPLYNVAIALFALPLIVAAFKRT